MDLPQVKIISFYTAKTPYEQEAQVLIAACQHFQLDFDIIAFFFNDTSLAQELLDKFQGKYLPLPVFYCKIFDLDQFFINDEEVVIEQCQASRSHR